MATAPVNSRVEIDPPPSYSPISHNHPLHPLYRIQSLRTFFSARDLIALTLKNLNNAHLNNHDHVPNSVGDHGRNHLLITEAIRRIQCIQEGLQPRQQLLSRLLWNKVKRAAAVEHEKSVEIYYRVVTSMPSVPHQTLNPGSYDQRVDPWLNSLAEPQTYYPSQDGDPSAVSAADNETTQAPSTSATTTSTDMPTHRTPLTKQQVGVFVSGYQVTYGRRPCDEPFDALREISGLSNNVNLGFSGDGVWISPTFSEDENQAISGFDLAICQDIVGDVPNLAPGSGEYRVLLKQEQPGAKITQMAIYRSNRAASTPPAGWDGISSNLNTGRKGAKECLYIVTRVWRGPFISAVVVSHAKGSSMPLADTLRPIDGGSPNINHGFDGQCVYLTPIYTSDPSQAARGFEVRLTTSDDSVGQDLSWGASGKPRWLVPTMGDFSGSRPMTHVELVRSEKKLKVTDAMTGNINEGRGGDFLYLRWPGA